MTRATEWCSGLQLLENGQTRCKHGHTGPGTSVCRGIRYTERSLAPCEREDLAFRDDKMCVDATQRDGALDMTPRREVKP